MPEPSSFFNSLPKDSKPLAVRGVGFGEGLNLLSTEPLAGGNDSASTAARSSCGVVAESSRLGLGQTLENYTYVTESMLRCSCI
jgi:hypothetical protein